MGVEGIGPEVASSVHRFFGDEKNRESVQRLRKAGVRIIEPGTGEKGRFAGKTFLFTGTLAAFSREEARDLVESLGGKTASSVSRKVDFVVVGEAPGSKSDKAKELGIRLLTEDEFRKMAG